MRMPRKQFDVTTQASVQKDYPVLSQNYATNDRMLRYKRIKDFFHGYILCNQEMWTIIKRTHLLPAFCY